MSEIEIIRIYIPAIILRRCTGCSDCLTACPINTQLIAKGDKNLVILVRNGHAVVNNPDLCDGCGVCMDACSQNAIKIEIKEKK
ncbi:MAG: ATP-binding protein [Candidatus Helarchaeota archaeon]